MSTTETTGKGPASKVETGVKLRGAEKVARIPVKVIPTEELPHKPDWIRVRMPASPEVERIKQLLRKHKLHSVCEEASCPNLGECFSGGTATFMIMGDICTRHCGFCAVGKGKPAPLDPEEPRHVGEAVQRLGVRHAVVTSVNRDELPDGDLGLEIGESRHLRRLIEAYPHLADLSLPTSGEVNFSWMIRARVASCSARAGFATKTGGSPGRGGVTRVASLWPVTCSTASMIWRMEWPVPVPRLRKIERSSRNR